MLFFFIFFSKFLPKSKWREMKIGYLALILKRYKYLFIYLFIYFLLEYSCDYGVEMIRWESGSPLMHERKVGVLYVVKC